MFAEYVHLAHLLKFKASVLPLIIYHKTDLVKARSVSNEEFNSIKRRKRTGNFLLLYRLQTLKIPVPVKQKNERIRKSSE